MVAEATGQLGPRKNAAGYLIASLLVIGLGTMLAGRVVKGFWLLLLAAAGTVAIVILYQRVTQETGPTTGLAQALSPGGRECLTAGCDAQTLALAALGVALLLLGLWVYGMIDAVRAVHQWNRAHGYTH